MQVNPQGRKKFNGSVNRVMRGGSWEYSSDVSRSSYCYWSDGHQNFADLGFRFVFRLKGIISGN